MGRRGRSSGVPHYGLLADKYVAAAYEDWSEHPCARKQHALDAAQQRARDREPRGPWPGWSPPIRLVDCVEDYHAPLVRETGGRRCLRFAFQVCLHRRPGGDYHIVCWGGDDTYYERYVEGEAKAWRIYHAIRDNTPVRSLVKRWHFTRY